YHFHAPGLLYAVVTFVLVLGAVNSQNNLLFWLFGLAVAGLIISGILSGASLMGLSVEREPPRRGAVGEDVVIRYRIRNRNRIFPSFALTIEELPHWSGGHRADWADRLERPLAYAVCVPARGIVVIETRARATARGPARLDAFRVSTTFP